MKLPIFVVFLLLLFNNCSKDLDGSGALDILVVNHPGARKSSQWSIRFGSLITIYDGQPVEISLDNAKLKFQGALDKNGDLHFAGSLFPTTEQLNSLNLKMGKNTLSFFVPKHQLTQTTDLYLVDPQVKLVISDIDGTITKSDVRGQIVNVLGLNTYAHDKVCSLYKLIEKNGYQLVYLTARAISQSGYTKKWIWGLSQNGEKLPLGPIITTADNVLVALKREVWDKRPDEFKKPILKQLRELFTSSNSLWAGFGNKPTDTVSYSDQGVDKNRIFEVDKQSVVTVIGSSEKTSYAQLTNSVNSLFPKNDKKLNKK